MIWRQRYRPNALSFLNQKVGIALSMETILHVHCVGSCIPLKGRFLQYKPPWQVEATRYLTTTGLEAKSSYPLQPSRVPKNGPEKPFQ